MIRRFLAVILGVFILGITTVYSQKTFQGTLEYKISLEGGMAEMMTGMMPDKYVFEILKKDYLLYMEGGIVSEMMGKVLYKDKTGEGFIIKDSEQTIYTLDMSETPASQNSIENTGEVAEIFGISCKKYKVITTVDDFATTQYVWATDKYALPEVKNSGGLNMNSTFYFDGIKGLPMRTELEVEGMLISMEIVNMDFTKPAKAHFTTPANYTVKPFDANTFMYGE